MPGLNLEEIARIINLVQAAGLDEITWQDGDTEIVVRGARRTAAGPSIAPPPQARRIAPRAGAEPPPPAVDANSVVLAAPMTGTFFRALTPDDPPLVDVGQHVEVGQHIGLIEAMKVFSDIPAEAAGTVIAIPARNGELVHAGAPLVLLRPD